MQPRPPDRATLRDLIAEAAQSLANGPHPARARLDAEMLLLHLLGGDHPEKNRAWLIVHCDSHAAPEFGAEYTALLRRRLAGEPIQYIVGQAEFYGLPFCVDRAVLIPRPETEHLVEKVLSLALSFATPRIADIGTGSGIIAVALAHKLPTAQITAIDCSAPALKVARANAERNGVADRIRFLDGDLLAPIDGERFDFVVSNPPYVAEQDRATLAVEVRDFEPALALFAGSDGFDLYRRLIPGVRAALVPGGFLVLEIGCGQHNAVAVLLAEAGFEQIEFAADLQGIPRVVSARQPWQ